MNLKSRFFRVGESSRKDFTFKPFSLLCLELGNSCKLKQCAFVSPFMGNSTLKFTSNSVVINRHKTHWSLPLASSELVDCFLSPSLEDLPTPLLPNSMMLPLSVSPAGSWSCSKSSASQATLPWVFLLDHSSVMCSFNVYPCLCHCEGIHSLASSSAGSVSYCFSLRFFSRLVYI